MKKIHFIAAGGTIDKIYFDAKSEYEVGSPQVQAILQGGLVTFAFEIESVLRKDSLDMTDGDRQTVRQRVEACACARVVVTHGTDTMVQTARALAGIPGKTIVLTGAMQPARFRETDAVFNLGLAVGAVQVLPPGVYLAMNGQIFDPQHAQKNVAQHCFEEIP